MAWAFWSHILLLYNNSKITSLWLDEQFWNDYAIGIQVESINRYASIKKQERERISAGKFVWRRQKKLTSVKVRLFLNLLLYLGTEREVGAALPIVQLDSVILNHQITPRLSDGCQQQSDYHPCHATLWPLFPFFLFYPHFHFEP